MKAGYKITDDCAFNLWKESLRFIIVSNYHNANEVVMSGASTRFGCDGLANTNYTVAIFKIKPKPCQTQS